MDILQWSITAILSLIGIYAGRSWEKYDRRVKKDKELIDKILAIIPVDSNVLNFLRFHDFGSSYRSETLTPLWELKRLFIQPNSFFLNKKLEKIRKDLQKELDNFHDVIQLEVFASERREGYEGLDKPYDTLRYLSQTKKAQGEIVSDEVRENIENHFEETVKELNQQSTNILDIYNSLIWLAHETL